MGQDLGGLGTRGLGLLLDNNTLVLNNIQMSDIFNVHKKYLGWYQSPTTLIWTNCIFCCFQSHHPGILIFRGLLEQSQRLPEVDLWKPLRSTSGSLWGRPLEASEVWCSYSPHMLTAHYCPPHPAPKPPTLTLLSSLWSDLSMWEHFMIDHLHKHW